MRVCIVCFGHLDATIPLAKYLSAENEVSLFCLFSNTSRNCDAIDLTGKDVRSDFINHEECKQYVDDEVMRYIGDRARLNIVIFRHFNAKRPSFYFKLMKLMNAIRKLQPDIVNIIGHAPFVKQINQFLWQFPRVHTVHEVVGHSEDFQFSESAQMLEYLVKKNQYFIFPSKITRSRFHERYDLARDHTCQIYFGNFELYGCYADPRTVADKASVLFLGRLLKYKGLEYLIEASEMCYKRIPHFKLLIVGRGKLDSLKQLVNKPYIEFINNAVPSSEVARYIERSAAVVCPYVSSSSSGIPMSAYVFNKPVIASDVDGLNEMVQESVNGLLVPPRDAKVLAGAIESVLLDEHLRNRLSVKNGSGLWRQEHDWSSIARNTSKFYSYVLSRH